MTVRAILAECIGSRNIADTVIARLAERGYAISLYKRPVDPEWQPATTAVEVNSLPAEDYFTAGDVQ
jgi:hypothetical protein